MKPTKKWKRGKINVQLTVMEMATLIEAAHEHKLPKRILNKLIKESDWYFDYPFNKSKK